MTALSDRIAAEHHYAPWPETVRGPIPYHLCAAGCEGVILEDQGDVRRHVADVTERAVRDTIVAELAEATSHVFYPTVGNPDSLTGKLYMQGVGAGTEFATLLAREGTTP